MRIQAELPPEHSVARSRCDKCHILLPPRGIHHVIGPWSADLLEQALQGELHRHDCPNCREPGHLLSPTLICAPTRNRVILYLNDLIIAPVRAKFEQHLLHMLEVRVGPGHEWLNLPRQRCSDIDDLKSALEIPDEFTWMEESAYVNRRARLFRGPTAKARTFVSQARELLVKQAGDDMVNVDEIALITLHTHFEHTALARAETLAAIADARGVAPPEWRKAWDFVDREVSGWKGEGSPKAGLDADIANLIDGYDPAHFMATPAGAHLFRHLLHVLRDHELHELAIDLCEGLMTHVDADDFSWGEWEAMCNLGVALIHYGADTSKSRRQQASSYLDTVVELLPEAQLADADKDVAFVAAYAREYLAICARADADLERSLQLYREAARLYRRADREDGADNCARSGLLVAHALRDTEAEAELADLTTEANPTALSSDAYQIRLFRQRHGHIGEARPKIIEFVEMTREITLGTMLGIKRLADRARHLIPKEMTREDWRAAIQNEFADFSEALVARRIDPSSGEPVIVDEVLAAHPYLYWIRTAPDESTRAIRAEVFTPQIWQWAGQFGIETWLREQIDDLKREHGSDPVGWRQSFRVGMGHAAAKLAVREDTNGRMRWAKETLWLLHNDGAFDDSGAWRPGEGALSHTAVLHLRSHVARAAEVAGKLKLAETLYTTNVSETYFLRETMKRGELKRLVQEVAGPDTGRRVRSLVRRQGYPLSPEAAREAHLVSATPRARLLMDRWRPERNDPSLDNLASPRDLAVLTLVQSVAEFKGHWLVTASGKGDVRAWPVDWDEPSSLIDHLKTTVRGARDHAQIIDAIARWASRDIAVHLRGDCDNWISPSVYLWNVPWGLLSCLPSRDPPRTVGVVLSPTLLDLTLSKPAANVLEGPTHAFIDPIGDLPDIRRILDRTRALNGFSVRHTIEASGARFLEAAATARTLLYVGHGRARGDDDDVSELLFARRSVTPHEVQALETRPTAAARLAIIISCWGGRTDGISSFSSWEPEGIPYALKSIGYDYIIATTEPISVRAAGRFVPALLFALRSGSPIPTAFRRAYGDLRKHLGHTALLNEAAFLQLYA